MIKKTRTSVIFILILGLAVFEAFADQLFSLPVGKNEIVASISKNEINRISFNKDIESVHSLKDELEYEIVGKDLYLRANVNKPINFFIRTFGGRVYKLIATPEDIPATQIFVRLQTTAKLAPKPSCRQKHLKNKENE